MLYTPCNALWEYKQDTTVYIHFAALLTNWHSIYIMGYSSLFLHRGATCEGQCNQTSGVEKYFLSGYFSNVTPKLIVLGEVIIPV